MSDIWPDSRAAEIQVRNDRDSLDSLVQASTMKNLQAAPSPPDVEDCVMVQEREKK